MPGAAIPKRGWHGTMKNLFGISRHLMRAKHYRLFRTEAFDMYQQVNVRQPPRRTTGTGGHAGNALTKFFLYILRS